MSLESITHTSGGRIVIPSSEEDWKDWVTATATRHYLLQDPLLSWLDLYGQSKGFQRDDELPGYDPRTDFSRFLFQKAKEFEVAVVKHLKTLKPVVTIATDPDDARNLDKLKETFAAMERGEAVIYQGVLWDGDSRTYGMPDLLIRSDVLVSLFPGSMPNGEARLPAVDLRATSWHYRIVDIKFTTLDLLAGGELGNSRSAPAYKAELFIYNNALGHIQGYTPPTSYLLGRGWKQTVKSVTSRGKSCMERLAPVPQNSTLSKGTFLAAAVHEACHWVRRARSNGIKWSVLPEPTVPELRPNMGNKEDSPWRAAKKQMAKDLEELTLLWEVGPGKRKDANNLGILRWRDSKCTAVSLGVTGSKTQPVLQAVLNINQSDRGPAVAPPRVTAAEHVWREQPILEFYVDFETVNDLNDDFSKIPMRGGQAMIFMIGCGHLENGNWQFKCFTADALTEAAEATMIHSWLVHLTEVSERLSASKISPLVFHWSQAETLNLEDSYNAAAQRHPKHAKTWPSLRWFDLLKQVVRAEPVVVRGALAFGLKEVAQAKYNLGLITTQWEEGPVDGLGAMVGAWWCGDEASRRGVALSKIELMQEIQRYNEVDCKVMLGIVQYLRMNH